MLHFCLQSGCLPVPFVIIWYGLCVIILLWDLPQSSLYGIDLAEAYRIWVTLSHRKVDQMLKSFSAFLCAEVKQSVQYITSHHPSELLQPHPVGGTSCSQAAPFWLQPFEFWATKTGPSRASSPPGPAAWPPASREGSSPTGSSRALLFQ